MPKGGLAKWGRQDKPAGAAMDDYTKHLLDRLEKTLEDSRALGRLAIGTVVTLGLAILAARGRGDELVPGLLSGVGIAFSLIVIAAFVLWSRALWLNDDEITRVAKALAMSEGAPKEASIDPKLKSLLDAKVQFRRRTELYILRQAVVGISLFIIWFHLADVWECVRHCKCGSVTSEETPSTIKVGATELILNGIGMRKAAGNLVYMGSLYLKDSSPDSNAILASPEPKAFRMRYVMDVPKRYADEAFRDAVKRGCPSPCTAVAEQDVEEFIKTLPPLKVNDVVLVELTSQTLSVKLNGEPIAVNRPPALGNAILRGFLDRAIRDKDIRVLRCGLLGFSGSECP
jgi:hypothetical protein